MQRGQTEGTLVPRKAQRIRLAQKSSVAQGAAAALAEGLAQVQHNAAAARRSSDPAFVHQLRVGLRRLRVFVRLFRGALGREQAQHLSSELRWLFGPLGELRDRQVFARDYLQEARGTQAAQAQGEAHTARSLAKARKLLTNPRSRALLAELEQRVRKLEKQSGGPRLRGHLRRKLKRRRRAALAHGQAVLHEDVPALHELRKELKKLRYTAELSRDLFPKTQVKAYLQLLSGVQDVLGELMDAHVARQRLAELKLSAPGRAELDQRITERERAALQALPPRFRALAEARPFWGRGQQR